MFLSHCLSLFSLSSEVADWPMHLKILHSHLPKCSLLLSLLCTLVANIQTGFKKKKDKCVMKKQRLQKVIKMYKKKVNTSLYIHRSNKCAMLYPLPSDKYKTKG